MSMIIAIIGLMALIGLFFGLILAVANEKLAVELNPLIHKVEDILPKGQCGACGFAGCQAYAEAVVMDKDVAPDLCIPGKSEVAVKVAELTGKKSKDIESKVAFIKCGNPMSIAKKKFKYSGIEDCVAASLLHFGPKDCQFGCIGFGTCVRQCLFSAITLNKKGLPVIDREICSGCGKCETVCPKKVIKMVPTDTAVEVACSSHDKAQIARKHCNIACLGCGLCKRNCKYGAIEIVDNIAIVDSKICKDNCKDYTCLVKCPTNALKS